MTAPRRRPTIADDTTARRYRTHRLNELTDALTAMRALAKAPRTVNELALLIGKHTRTVRRLLKALAYTRCPVSSHFPVLRASRRVRLWWIDEAALVRWVRSGPGKELKRTE